MSVKTISIRDDVYKMLKDAKHEEESFSDVIERLLRKEKVDLTKYFGALKESSILYGQEEDSKRVKKVKFGVYIDQ
jgi:predicted CopG family antitoxin